jgi:hypothetical protein
MPGQLRELRWLCVARSPGVCPCREEVDPPSCTEEREPLFMPTNFVFALTNFSTIRHLVGPTVAQGASNGWLGHNSDATEIARSHRRSNRASRRARWRALRGARPSPADPWLAPGSVTAKELRCHSSTRPVAGNVYVSSRVGSGQTLSANRWSLFPAEREVGIIRPGRLRNFAMRAPGPVRARMERRVRAAVETSRA